MMKHALILSALIAVAFPASAQFCAEQSISWTQDGARHETIIEGRIRDGCPMMRQTIRLSSGELIAQSGPDCDCDLIIDGREGEFSAPLAIVSGRMLDVCHQNRDSARMQSAAIPADAG